MNQLISCSFCRNHTLDGPYYCCDENEISCFACKQFGCHVCRQRFTKRMEQCCECKRMLRRQHLFGDGYYKFCVNCCRKDFGDRRDRKIGFNKFGLAKDRFQVYQFLRKFCTGCDKFIQKISQDDRSKLKEILPLDNNLCDHCKSLDPQMRGFKSLDARGTYFRSPVKTSNGFFNGSVFNREKQKCINCDLTILGSYQNIEGHKICSFCLKRPNEQEKYLSGSRMKLRSMKSGNELEETKATQSSVYSSKHQQTCSQKNNWDEDTGSSKSKIKPMSLLQEGQKIKKLESQEVILKVPVEKAFDNNNTNMRQGNDQPIIKDEVQQKSLNKVKRTQSWNDDIIMEPVADHEYRKKLSKMSSDKMSEIPETYESQENDHRKQISSRGSTEERLMGPQNDESDKVAHRNIKKNDQMERVETLGESEPVIIEQHNKNKVKRLESWNDEIILEPVEDHERRKKQKADEMERSKIVEQDENEEDTQSLSTHSTNYKIGINQPKPQQRKSQNQETQKEQKSKLHPSMANFTKPEETKYYKTGDSKDVQSKYSFTSDKLKESRISTKSQNKKSEPSAIDQQNYDRRLRSSQMFNKDKIEESASNSKRTEAARPEASNSYDNRNYKYNGNANQGYSKLNSPSSAYYQTYDRTKPFTSTTRVINDGGRYIPTSQRPFNYETIKTTTYRSPQRETYYYSNLPNRQQTSHVYTSPKHSYQDSTASRTSTSNIRDSRTQHQSNNENSSRSPTIKACSSCSNKIVDSSRTFTLNSQPICEGCWENYNKKKFDEPEMRSGFYSRYNYY